MQVAVRVRGNDAQGKAFEEEASTLAINAHGALIQLQSRLTSGSVVLMQHKHTQEECRISRPGPLGEGGNWIGIHRRVSQLLAGSVSAGGLEPQASRRPHGNHEYTCLEEVRPSES
jgi:hypothetical protein